MAEMVSPADYMDKLCYADLRLCYELDEATGNSVYINIVAGDRIYVGLEFFGDNVEWLNSLTLYDMKNIDGMRMPGMTLPRRFDDLVFVAPPDFVLDDMDPDHGDVAFWFRLADEVSRTRITGDGDEVLALKIRSGRGVARDVYRVDSEAELATYQDDFDGELFFTENFMRERAIALAEAMFKLDRESDEVAKLLLSGLFSRVSSGEDSDTHLALLVNMAEQVSTLSSSLNRAHEVAEDAAAHISKLNSDLKSANALAKEAIEKYGILLNANLNRFSGSKKKWV